MATAPADQLPPLPSTLRRSCAWWRPGGTPRRSAAHTGIRPLWWCTSTLKSAPSTHLGLLLSDTERRYLTCDATCEVWFERHGAGHRCRADDAADQPAASPRAGASRPHVRGSGLRYHPRSTRPSHSALGRRRPDGVGQSGAPHSGGSCPLHISVCSSTYSCRPSGPNSRPMPDCLKPPNGAPMSSVYMLMP